MYNFTNTNLDYLNLSAIISKVHIFLHFYQFILTFTFDYATAFHHSKYDINISSSYPVITNKPSWPNAAAEDSDNGRHSYNKQQVTLVRLSWLATGTQT